MNKIILFSLIVLITLTGIILPYGCGKKQPPASNAQMSEPPVDTNISIPQSNVTTNVD